MGSSSQCGSVGWASLSISEGCGFNSWSGPMLELWIPSGLGCMRKTTDRCVSLALMFLSLSFSLSPPFSKTKNQINFFERWVKYSGRDKGEEHLGHASRGTVRTMVQGPLRSDLGKALDKRSRIYQWVIVIGLWSAWKDWEKIPC